MLINIIYPSILFVAEKKTKSVKEDEEMEETAVADGDGEPASDKPEETEEEEENGEVADVEDEEDDQPELPSGLTGTEQT